MKKIAVYKGESPKENVSLYGITDGQEITNQEQEVLIERSPEWGIKEVEEEKTKPKKTKRRGE